MPVALQVWREREAVHCLCMCEEVDCRDGFAENESAVRVSFSSPLPHRGCFKTPVGWLHLPNGGKVSSKLFHIKSHQHVRLERCSLVTSAAAAAATRPELGGSSVATQH